MLLRFQELIVIIYDYMPKDVLRSGEIPFNLKVVVADDEAGVAKRTKIMWEKALQDKGGFGFEVSTVTGYEELLQTALIGVSPDVVVLDHKYEEDYGSWRPTEEGLERIASAAGLDFAPIKKPDRGGWEVSGEMPDDLYHPNSVHFGLLLRYLGFTGKIVVVSNDPPEPDYVLREFSDLNTYLDKFGITVIDPIDGVLLKPSRYEPNKFSYATRYAPSFLGGNRWDWQNVEGETFAVGVGSLIDELF